MRTTPATKKLGGASGKGFMPGKSGNPGGRPKGARTLIFNIREMFARAIKTEDVEQDAIARVQENLRGKRTVLSTLELAARLNKEIGLGSEDRPPGVTITFVSNLKPGALKRKAG